LIEGIVMRRAFQIALLFLVGLSGCRYCDLVYDPHEGEFYWEVLPEKSKTEPVVE
jgi:hypothetical protein